MLSEELVNAVLDDWRKAPINEQLRSTLGLLEKLTLSPGDVRLEDVRRLQATGVSDQAMADAIQVCALFNIIDRVADSLEFEIPSPEDFVVGANILFKRGYR